MRSTCLHRFYVPRWHMGGQKYRIYNQDDSLGGREEGAKNLS